MTSIIQAPKTMTEGWVEEEEVEDEGGEGEEEDNREVVAAVAVEELE